MKTILLMGVSKEKTDRISGLAGSMGITVKEVSSGDLDKPIGKILNMPGEFSVKKKAPALFAVPELMVFFGVTDKDLDSFLSRYEESGISPILLKGVVTIHNIAWSPYELILEYREESKLS